MYVVDPAKRMPFLAAKIFEWRAAYYRGDEPIVSDAVYDYAERELAALEAVYPELITYESPIGKVGN